MNASATMVTASYYAFSRSPVSNSRYSRDLCTRHFTGWSTRAGSPEGPSGFGALNNGSAQEQAGGNRQIEVGDARSLLT